MKKYARLVLVCGFLSTAISPCSAQPAFQNLDFESANVPDISFGQYPPSLAFSNVFPGWTGYIGTQQIPFAGENAFTTGAPNIAILTRNYTRSADIPVFAGNYSAVLQAGLLPPYDASSIVSAAIVQTGLIPATARSIQITVRDLEGMPALDALGVTVGGQNIVMVPLQVTPGYTGYTVCAGDISAFSGQVDELRIEAHPIIPHDSNASLELDSIQFSLAAVPEPPSLNLATGAFLLAFLFAGPAAERRKKVARGLSRGFARLFLLAPSGATEPSP